MSAERTTRYRDRNELPRPRIHAPDGWRNQVAGLNPLDNPDGSWICFEADSALYHHSDPETGEPAPLSGVRKALSFFGDCPVCLQRASKKCSRCLSVYYCSKACQTKHWKQSHKVACSPNPKVYSIRMDLNMFRPLQEGAVADAFEGFEFLLIKACDRLLSDDESAACSPVLAGICSHVLEPADDIMQIPGFGVDQITPLWLAQNGGRDPTSKRLVQKFGWTSGRYSVDVVEGYRFAEDICVYMVLSDDCFSIPEQSPGLHESFYGRAIFPSVARSEKKVRGDIVIFKIFLKNKRFLPANDQMAARSLSIILGDDSNLRYEYELYPLCKAEIAHLLVERLKALDEDAYTRRMWRHQVHLKELAVECQQQHLQLL